MGILDNTTGIMFGLIWGAFCIAGLKKVNRMVHLRPFPNTRIWQGVLIFLGIWYEGIGWKMGVDPDYMLYTWIEDNDNFVYALIVLIITLRKLYTDVFTKHAYSDDDDKYRAKKDILNPVTHFFFSLIGTAFILSLLPWNINVLVHRLDIFTEQETDYILKEVVKYSEKNGWDTDNYGDFPTHDVSLDLIPKIYKYTMKKLKKSYYPFIRCKYGVRYMSVEDLFVVRYKNSQIRLEEHFDGGDVTLNVMLSKSSEYTGGGTRVNILHDKVFHLNKTQALTHSANVYHAGEKVLSGTRFLLIGRFWYAPTNYFDIYKWTYMRGIFTLNPQLREYSYNPEDENYYLNNCGIGR